MKAYSHQLTYIFGSLARIPKISSSLVTKSPSCSCCSSSAPEAVGGDEIDSSCKRVLVAQRAGFAGLYRGAGGEEEDDSARVPLLVVIRKRLAAAAAAVKCDAGRELARGDQLLLRNQVFPTLCSLTLPADLRGISRFLRVAEMRRASAKAGSAPSGLISRSF